MSFVIIVVPAWGRICDNLTGQICWQANLEVSQFGRKINKNDLPSLVLKQQQKNFVMPQRQLKRQW